MSQALKNSDAPAPLAHEAIHDTVVRILDGLPRGVVLDVPAGEGALAARLVKLGFDVRCCDLYTEIFKLKDTRIDRGNLDERLPYDDLSFDGIVCVEGLEHIENPANAIREFDRVLKPGGVLIVSVPNIMNIEERLKWLFNGYTSHFKPISASVRASIAAEFGGMDEIALHVNPIGYSELRYLLEKSGFAVEGTFIDKPKRKSFLYLPLVWLIRFVGALSSSEKRAARWTRELNSAPVLLGGNTLIFKAVKHG